MGPKAHGPWRWLRSLAGRLACQRPDRSAAMSAGQGGRCQSWMSTTVLGWHVNPVRPGLVFDCSSSPSARAAVGELRSDEQRPGHIGPTLCLNYANHARPSPSSVGAGHRRYVPYVYPAFRGWLAKFRSGCPDVRRRYHLPEPVVGDAFDHNWATNVASGGVGCARSLAPNVANRHYYERYSSLFRCTASLPRA
jgi:hypothetical protein